MISEFPTLTVNLTNLPSLLKAFKSLRLYANVQNLYTFTNYSGYDPNVNAQSKNGLRPGFDIGAYPLSRTISFGLNVNL